MSTPKIDNPLNTGNPGRAGVAILRANKVITCMASVMAPNKSSVVMPSFSVGDARQPDTGYVMCGDNTNGIAVACGNKVQTLNILGNGAAKWENLPIPFEQGSIAGITGDDVNGFTIFSSDNEFYQSSFSGSEKREWKKLTSPLSLQPRVIAGDAAAGLVAVGTAGDGSGEERAARSGRDLCSWIDLPRPPFAIDLICGGAGSYVAYGEGQFALLDTVNATWTRLPWPNFPIKAMSGNAKDGLVALVGSGDVLAYCTDVTKGVWVLAMILDPVVTS
jgi:hypothetical protein